MQRLALGTAKFGLNYGVAKSRGQTVVAEVERILSAADIAGLDTLDTAIGYGDSEQVLGDIGFESFDIVTKLPALPKDQVDVIQWVEQQLEDSCERLKRPGLYAVLLHRPTDLLGAGGKALARSLQVLKEDRVVQKVGVSIYDPEELTPIEKILDIDLVQAPLNVVDRRLQTSGWLHRLKDSGVEIHARSVFLQGLLLMDRSDIPPKFERWSRLWDDWQHFLSEKGTNALSACLSYPLSLPEVDRVVVGVDSSQQLKDIVAVAEGVDHSIDTSFMV
jgi:aryl-alcohol dehydrogenase-like predicted oxidoreductase